MDDITSDAMNTTLSLIGMWMINYMLMNVLLSYSEVYFINHGIEKEEINEWYTSIASIIYATGITSLYAGAIL